MPNLTAVRTFISVKPVLESELRRSSTDASLVETFGMDGFRSFAANLLSRGVAESRFFGRSLQQEFGRLAAGSSKFASVNRSKI